MKYDENSRPQLDNNIVRTVLENNLETYKIRINQLEKTAQAQLTEFEDSVRQIEILRFEEVQLSAALALIR